MTGEQAPVSDGINVSRELSFRGADSVELQLHREEAAVPADMQTPSFCTLAAPGHEALKGPCHSRN